jgi:hemerythrin-like domain-containing protein
LDYPPDMPSQPSPSEMLARALATIHVALRRSLDTIVQTVAAPIPESERSGFADFCERFARLLHSHHDGEEEVVFPVLTEAATRAAMPERVANVAKWRAEHQSLLSHLRDFETACVGFRSGGSQAPLERAAKEVRAELIPHLDVEESVVDASLIAKLLGPEQVMQVGMAAAKHGQQSAGPKALMLFVHALTDDEQRFQFAQIPWFVRKVLIKRIWSRDFRGCLKYAHNQNVAL